jgi:hypothetical protein
MKVDTTLFRLGSISNAATEKAREDRRFEAEVKVLFQDQIVAVERSVKFRKLDQRRDPRFKKPNRTCETEGLEPGSPGAAGPLSAGPRLDAGFGKGLRIVCSESQIGHSAKH